MQQHYDTIRDLLRRARRRWRTLAIFKAGTRAALAAAGVVAVAIAAAALAAHAPLTLAIVLAVAIVGVLAAAAWGLASLRHVPGDARVARFVEERVPELDDRLVSAVDAMATQRHAGSPAIAEAMLADAARHAGRVDLESVIPSRTLRRAGFQAAAAGVLLVALLFAGRDRARQGIDAAALALFPGHVRLEVAPGNARLRAGTPLTIEAALVGNRAPVSARVQFKEGDGWRDAAMDRRRDGRFALGVGTPRASFDYRVVAGPATSPTYAVNVVRPPRVTRIDVDYTFPPDLGLKPRTDEDSGDIYAPAGTDVRVRIHTDRPAANGRMNLADGKAIPLSADGGVLVGRLKVVDDNSYRIALADREGLSDPGDTEYFIRTLEDRPPSVRILKPASDRTVTRLEEVDVEAQADDDYGISRMELVYSVRGGKEQVVPFAVPPRQPSVSGRRTMYLEDLGVQPGDLISYYVRARDLSRGRHASEAKSDIFFLEVKPYDEEFALAQSQAGPNGGGPSSSIDDLVTAQKQVVVATWKLDRRSQTAKGAKPEQDIRSVSRAEAELKSRVEQTSGTFRESTMRDPRKRPQRGRAGQPSQPSATQALPEEDEMGAAAASMQQAVGSLDALKTNDALPPEMEALNHLLKAQSEVKKRQIARQQSGAGRADNNRNYDLSTLFDRELQKSQQTNYETPTSAEQRDDPGNAALDKIRDLARRQDELVKRQQELAKNRASMSEEELKRQLDKLTRDQLELRQKAEDLARQMQRSSPQAGGEQSGQQQASGERQSQRGQQSGQQSGGRQSARSQGQSQGASGSNGSMQSASEEMRKAAGELRNQDPQQASAAAGRALDRLRDLERQLQASRPDERRRAVGDMQLEARQLADNQRDIASELEKAGNPDALRRLAGEQQRLADRVRQLEQGLKRAGANGGQPDRGASARGGERKDTGAAAADGARELERQRLADRMQQSADQMRQAAERQQGGSKAGDNRNPGQGGAAAQNPAVDARAEAGQQQEMARSLDKLADKLAGAVGSGDAQTQKLSEQLARAQQLRDRLDQLSRQIQQQANREGAQQSAGKQAGSRQQGGQHQAGGQQQAGGRQSGGQQSAGQSGAQATGQQGASGQTAAGQTGQQNHGEAGGTAGGNDLARLRDEYQRELQQTRDLLDQLRHEDPSFNAQHGAGFTFEGQGMTLSAPGTEAFKQDFAKWEELRRQATQALDNAQLSISQKLQAKEARDRLTAGIEDRAPADYQKQVDSYFKSIASKRKPQ